MRTVLEYLATLIRPLTGVRLQNFSVTATANRPVRTPVLVDDSLDDSLLISPPRPYPIASWWNSPPRMARP